MDIPHRVAARIQADPKLLHLLKAGSPDARIKPMAILKLGIPAYPKPDAPEAEHAAVFEKIRTIVKDAIDDLSSIDGLHVRGSADLLGWVYVNGTAGALVKAIDNDAVEASFLNHQLPHPRAR